MVVIQWYTVITMALLYALVKSSRNESCLVEQKHVSWDFIFLFVLALAWPILPIGILASWALNRFRKKHQDDVIPDDESD